MDFAKLLESMKKSSIRINYDFDFNGECSIGDSKIGGKPDLPLDFKWYYFHGKSYDEIIANRPLSFIAQINCEEVREYDKDSLLPPKGFLYFFYELATTTWGFDPKDKGSARVYYYPGSVSELQRTDFPLDLSDEFKFPEMPIKFTSKGELPAFEEFIEWHEGVDYDKWNDYDDVKVKMGFDSEFDTEEEQMGKINKFLGYANLIQGGMLLECEQVANGIYSGEPIDIPEEKIPCYDSLEGTTKYKHLYEDGFYFSLKMTKLGHAIIEGAFQEYPHLPNKLVFQFETDQTCIQNTIRDLRQIEKLFGDNKGIYLK